MRLSEFPQFESFRHSRQVKVLRHMDRKLDLWQLRERGQFNQYQNNQSWDVFGKAEYVISFIGESFRFARFVGVWEVLGSSAKLPRGVRYRTRELEGFAELEGRLVVNWGGGTRSWAQWMHREGNKEVAELLPRNYVKEFPGFYDFALTYEELSKIVAHPDANREWHRMLSAVSGVYLILDTRSGKQYVGSAYGKGGILSRWRSYVRTGSGGNLQIAELLKVSKKRVQQFQFSLLRVLEPGIPRADVLEHEALIKRKLGCRVFGLNSN